ncbi:MAG TPA: membrane protein insertion efficiency factor YidD [Anaerolineaceae bacterium]
MKKVHNHQPDPSEDAYAREPRLQDFRLTVWRIPQWILLALIRAYQNSLSKGLPPNTCRFYPSCSHYGYQAVYKYGAIKGSVMAIWRILRCNPFNPGGYDPVP